MKKTLLAIVRMFKRVGLQKNIGNTKSMVFTQGFLWGKRGILTYKRRARGEGVTFGERKRTRVSCEELRGEMMASSLFHHMERTRGIVLSNNRGLEAGVGGPDTYRVSFPWVLKEAA